MISDAIKSAPTDHVVYFLLTAYVETLGHTDTFGIPETVRRLPIRDKSDVVDRSNVMREALYRRRRHDSSAKPVVAEAADVFKAAAEQLETIQPIRDGAQRCSRADALDTAGRTAGFEAHLVLECGLLMVACRADCRDARNTRAHVGSSCIR